MLVKFKAQTNYISINYINSYLLVNLFTRKLVMQLPVMLESVQSILAGFLVALLLGVAFASAALMSADDNLCIEERRPVVRLCFIK